MNRDKKYEPSKMTPMTRFIVNLWLIVFFFRIFCHKIVWVVQKAGEWEGGCIM